MESFEQNSESNNSFICLLCKLEFISNEELKDHLQDHNGEKPFFCVECDKRYAYKATLKKHMDSHIKEKLTYKCSKCDYICESKRALTDHEIAHQSKINFSCTECDYKSISKNSLSKHIIENNHGNSYKCTECESEFRFLNSLIKHANEIHKNKQPFTCSMCDKSYSKNQKLKEHMKIHTVHDTIIINEENEEYCDNETDQNNNIKDTIPSTSNTNVLDIDVLPTKCVSCTSKINKIYKN